MDVRALYPSITAAHAGEAVKAEMETTRLQIKNVDYGMALRFLSKAAKSDKEIRAWGFGRWCPKRTKTPDIDRA